MMYMYFLLIFKPLIITLLNTRTVEGIVGGTISPANRFKYQVSLHANDKHICGASIIGDRYILSAAHCVIEKDNTFTRASFTVVVGVSDISDNNKIVINVKKVYVPKEFVYSFKGHHAADIAVLKLKTGLGHSRNLAEYIIALPKLSDTSASYQNQEAIITGYGYTKVTKSNNDNGSSSIQFVRDSFKMKFAETKVLNNQACALMYQSSILVDRFCARIDQDSNPNGGVCKGDSGGPLVTSNNVVIGILSVGTTLCNEHYLPGIYTTVATYLPFISNVMKNEDLDNIRIAAYYTNKTKLGSKVKKIFKKSNAKVEVIILDKK